MTVGRDSSRAPPNCLGHSPRKPETHVLEGVWSLHLSVALAFFSMPGLLPLALNSHWMKWVGSHAAGKFVPRAGDGCSYPRPCGLVLRERKVQTQSGLDPGSPTSWASECPNHSAGGINHRRALPREGLAPVSQACLAATAWGLKFG